MMMKTAFALTLMTGIAMPTLAKTVSDHRVQSLSCKNVNSDSVALSMRPEVFSSSHHLPYRNWAFQWGFYELANCWSLSRYQRLYFYLREPASAPANTEMSNQARSEDMYEDGNEWKGWPRDTFSFLPEQTDAKWAAWETGWTENGWSARPLERGLKPDIEYYQVLRFHQLDNFKYLKGPIARTPAENDTTWSDLSSLIANGRKPLVLLRPAVYSQHVVVAKRVEPTRTGAKIWVYDSNSPSFERSFEWNASSSMFTAYDIVSGIAGVADPNAPVGIFIVDDEENERLLESLATHYKAVCAAP